MVKSHASLFGLKFWTFNLGDNRPTLKPGFGVEGRSILTLGKTGSFLLPSERKAGKTVHVLLFGILSDRFLGFLYDFKLMIAVSFLFI